MLQISNFSTRSEGTLAPTHHFYRVFLVGGPYARFRNLLSWSANREEGSFPPSWLEVLCSSGLGRTRPEKGPVASRHVNPPTGPGDLLDYPRGRE